MGLEDFPEVKLAKKIFKLQELNIPFEIEALVKKYATVIYKSIPIEGIDGVSLNLKVPQKHPKVIVNSNISKKRQTFTLAHELGHIIIPWHLGTIVDDIYSQGYKDYEYSIIEQEANRFAAELLMPTEWVIEKYSECNYDIAILHNQIVTYCNVSDQAAAIRIVDLLPKNIIYCAVSNMTVLHSGRTNLTAAYLQESNSTFDINFYPYIDNYYTVTFGNSEYHWWRLSSKVKIETNEDIRTWREILDSIVEDLNLDEEPRKFKSSINGIIAHANGKAKQEGDYSIDSVISTAIYRLRRDNLEDFVAHKDFELFILKKVKSMFEK